MSPGEPRILLDGKKHITGGAEGLPSASISAAVFLGFLILSQLTGDGLDEKEPTGWFSSRLLTICANPAKVI